MVLALFDYNNHNGIKKMVEALGKQRDDKWCHRVKLDLKEIEKTQDDFVMASTLNFFDILEMSYNFLKVDI